MHHISKNWEPVFDFQYKVVVGQCDVLKFRNDHLEQKITWSIKAKAYALSSGGKQCDLCLTEKLTILMADPKSTLNKRDEIMAKCKHKRKYILGTVKPTITEQEPPDPT